MSVSPPEVTDCVASPIDTTAYEAMRASIAKLARHILQSDRSFQNSYRVDMARSKEFDKDRALAAAIGVFREHGYEGTSAGMLTDAMMIGRQSLYDTFGDKWRLYCDAVRAYSVAETSAHIAALSGGETALAGIRLMIERVVETAATPCLGVGSICEFGETHGDLVGIRTAASRSLHAPMVETIRAAQADGALSSELDPDDVAVFLVASIAGIRIAGRGGAGKEQLQAPGSIALQALR